MRRGSECELTSSDAQFIFTSIFLKHCFLPKQCGHTRGSYGSGKLSFSPNSLLLGVLNSFLRCVRPWWCPPFSAGRAAFLFICLPGLSPLVSAVFRYPCSCLPGLSLLVSACRFCRAMQHFYDLSPRSVIAGVRPFPLAMQHFYLFVSVSLSLCPSCLPLSPVLFPFLLVTVSALSPFCFLLLVAVSALSPFCLLSCLPSCWSLCPPCLPSVSFCLPSCFPSCWSSCPPCLPSCLRLLSLLSPVVSVLPPFLWVTVSALSPFCFLLSPFLSLLVGDCVRLVSLLSPFVSGLLCLLVGHCVRLVCLLSLVSLLV